MGFQEQIKNEPQIHADERRSIQSSFVWSAFICVHLRPKSMSLTSEQSSTDAHDQLDPKSFGEAKDESQLMSLRSRIDESCKWPCLVFFATGTGWLVIGSLFALVASIKL